MKFFKLKFFKPITVFSVTALYVFYLTLSYGVWGAILGMPLAVIFTVFILPRFIPALTYGDAWFALPGVILGALPLMRAMG